MNSIDWTLAAPQYDQIINSDQDTTLFPYIGYESFQGRLISSVKQFLSLDSTNLMLVKAPDNAAHQKIISEFFSVRGTSVMHTSTVSSEEMFGSLSRLSASDKYIKNDGILTSSDADVIILSINFLLANPLNWLRIKSLISGESVNPICKDAAYLYRQDFSYKSNKKFVFVGDRSQLAELEYLDIDIFSALSMYTEFESEVKLTEANIKSYIGLINQTSGDLSLPKLNISGVKALLTSGARECEEQHFVPICPIWLSRIISEAANVTKTSQISGHDVELALANRYYRESYLTNRALDDILDGQVLIETNGEQMGQVNGLTVVELSGHPVSYGEPARISCVVHFGDGDVADVERKADLGGNLHAKGMMIMQAFLSSELKLEEPIPFSASIVFEQSYSEVDGDSASLAELCSLVSALSELPIKQEIAVTGAVDQFGRVQAVGGLNEKIEGFYYVCAHQGLTGKQGVIIPRSNLRHLALHKDVLESIKHGQFHIWAVDNVEQALTKLVGVPFKDSEDETILDKIATRIDRFHHLEPSTSLLRRITGWFN